MSNAFPLGDRDRVEESLHGRLAIAPSTLMRSPRGGLVKRWSRSELQCGGAVVAGVDFLAKATR
ncbi:hypothetical protein MB84_28230 (plasmid) [Pandoraea oxalativorans]|uniref:Uncharacterized protein n=1 Tax=Pandoraea oxalativorans TaxID=573737 RepID=A0A0G3IHQ0_9BURK|nr:hypothetical protein MB84_28230 [Pandoraea oxalativorans]